MATLGNLLKLQSGTPCTGRRVAITLALPGPKGGPPLMTDAEVLLLPVSEARKARAFRAADAYVAEQQKAAEEAGEPGAAPSVADERALRLLVEAMKDPDDARRYFVEGDKVDDLRSSLVFEQVQLLSREYGALIAQEYPELVSAADRERMAAEAQATFTAGQRSP